MTELRKVFICKSCEGIYADEPVTACDCMPSKNHVYEFEHGYILDEETKRMVLELCRNVMQNVASWSLADDAEAILERPEAR